MSETNKNTRTPVETLAEVGQQIGLVLMTAAATIGTLPDHPDAKIVLPSQPVFARVTESGENTNPLRREREETAPHFISYSVVQRTPSRSGKQ